MQSWHKRPRSCAIGFEQQEPWATRAPLSGVQCHSEVQGGGGGQWVQASFNKHRHTLALLHHTCPFTHIKQDYRYYMRHYSGQWRHDGTLGVLLSLAYRSFNLNSFLLSHSLSLAVHLISLSLYIYISCSLSGFLSVPESTFPFLSACVPLSTQTQSIWLCKEAQRQCFYWGPALLLTWLAWVLRFSQTPFLSSALKRQRPSGTRSHRAASHQDRLRLQPALHLRGPRSGRKLGGAPLAACFTSKKGHSEESSTPQEVQLWPTSRLKLPRAWISVECSLEVRCIPKRPRRVPQSSCYIQYVCMLT